MTLDVSISMLVDGKSKTFKFDPTKGREDLPSLKQIKGNASDLRVPFEEVHKLLLAFEKSVFLTLGGVLGAPWPSYNEAERKQYVPYKRAILGDENPIMRWRGGNNADRLYKSLTDASSTDHIWQTDESNFVFGTKVPYAAGHHEGTGKGWNDQYTVPKRQLIGGNRDLVRNIIKELQSFIFGGL